MMADAFHFSKYVNNLLFKGWTTTNVQEFVGTCIGLGVLAFLTEGLALFIVYMGEQAKIDPLTPSSDTDSNNGSRSPLLRSLMIPPSIEDIRKRKISIHIAQTFNHLLRLILGYLLMLAVMSYNAWIGISIVIGYGLGYYVFGAARGAIRYQGQPIVKQPELEITPEPVPVPEILESDHEDT